MYIQSHSLLRVPRMHKNTIQPPPHVRQCHTIRREIYAIFLSWSTCAHVLAWCVCANAASEQPPQNDDDDADADAQHKKRTNKNRCAVAYCTRSITFNFVRHTKQHATCARIAAAIAQKSRSTRTTLAPSENARMLRSRIRTQNDYYKCLVTIPLFLCEPARATHSQPTTLLPTTTTV